MKLRYVIGTTLAALLAGTAGVVLSVGMGDDAWLAKTPAGRWLGLKAPNVVPPNGVVPALGGQSVGALALTDVDRRPQSLPRTRPDSHRARGPVRYPPRAVFPPWRVRP